MPKNILVLVLLLFTSCIDPLDFRSSEQGEHLVVEGSFTNDPEQNYVRLSYSRPYADPYTQFVLDAEVYVTSAEGEHYRFANDGDDGNYFPVQPLEAAGVVGHTYTLHIEVNGKAYESGPITLKKPVPIDSVRFEVDEQVYSFPGYKERKVWPGYSVQVGYQDPADEKNFLRWTFSSQYEVSTQPRNAQPEPKDCCSRCFFNEVPRPFHTVDDRLTDGQQVTNQEVFFIPFERYLGVKYKLDIYQYAISEEAYEFFRIMEEQKQGTGTVFDPPPAQVTGNLYNVNDEDEQVIGFFDVSGVSKRQVVIKKEDIKYPFMPYEMPNDCREMDGAFTEIPEGW
ncbi:DUF4249 domain-containing protein [Pontibacter actiniarum]|uniref:DUF4249 domain-containing protein n=1 Tax=Pontibacter actiniarum TaxID=323450 RepID=A0A1X9YUW1_9BACT|nr:DUF4249 domain-containing protein [Pontibacter actiniarum]ARS36675.1 hypothetical protein CA264_15310 [Pontibacter actiniarum]